MRLLFVVLFSALVCRNTQAQFALHTADATGNNQVTPLTYFLDPRAPDPPPGYLYNWHSTDLFQIYERLDSLGCNTWLSAPYSHWNWSNTDLYQIWLKLDSCGIGGGGSGPIADSAWTLFGNAGLSVPTNFFGTTDSTDILIKTNNLARWYFKAQKGWLSFGANDTTFAELQINHTANDGGYDAWCFRNTVTGYMAGLQEEGGLYLNLTGAAGIPAINGALYIKEVGSYTYSISLNGSNPNIYFGSTFGTITMGANGFLTLNTTSSSIDLGAKSGADLRLGGDPYLGTAGKGVHLGAYNGSAWTYPFKVLNKASTICDIYMQVPVANNDTIYNVTSGHIVNKQAQLTVGAEINTTAGDGATINARAGRFRKDTSGAAFTLTNSMITANSIILLTPANAAIDATATTWTVSAGSGTATITLNAAPTANFDINFVVVN